MHHRFTLVGDASPQLPLRVLNLFAQQELLPASAVMRRRGDDCEMVVECDGLDAHRASIVLAKMEAMVLVRSSSIEAVETQANRQGKE